jgi:hypothetical protein
MYVERKSTINISRTLREPILLGSLTRKIGPVCAPPALSVAAVLLKYRNPQKSQCALFPRELPNAHGQFSGKEFQLL